jgi:hypothetical protein
MALPGFRSCQTTPRRSKSISPSAMVTLKINNGTYNTVMVGKSSTQQMSRTSLELLQDVKDDTVDQFIAKYPGWVTQS